MESTIKHNESDHDNKENNSNCPKCLSGDMVEHASFYPFPLLLVQILLKNQTFIEDQDADLSSNSFHLENVGIQNFI